jgi:hypothetical protein
MPGLGGFAAHELNHYRCFLPDLAGFAAARCTKPETQQLTSLPCRLEFPYFAAQNGLANQVNGMMRPKVR